MTVIRFTAIDKASMKIAGKTFNIKIRVSQQGM
jgi:hypothetical protein